MKLTKRILIAILALAVMFSAAATGSAALDPDPDLYAETSANNAQLILGDADTDCDITVMDATAIQRYLAELTEEIGERQADVDSDDSITILDATYLQLFLAEIDVSFDIGQPIPVKSLFLIRENYVTYVGGSTGIKPIMLPADYESLRYTSDNPRVARVQNDGLVIGVRTGETDITIKSYKNPDVSVRAHVKVLSSERYASKLDDYYASVSTSASYAAKLYINSDPQLKKLFSNYAGLNYDTFTALYLEQTQHENYVNDLISEGISAKRYPFSNYTSEDALASMLSTANMSTNTELTRNNNVAEAFVKKYFSKIDAVTDMNGLLKLCADIWRDGGYTILDIAVTDNELPEDGFVYLKTLEPADTMMHDFSDYRLVQAANTMLQGFFVQAGMTSSKAKTEASALVSMMKKFTAETNAYTDRIVAQNEKNGGEDQELLEMVTGKAYDVADLDRMLSGFSLKNYLSYLGLSADGKIIVESPAQLEIYNRYLNKSNLSVLKTYLKYTVASNALFYTTNGNKTYNTFLKAVYGEIVPLDELYSYKIADLMQWDYTKLIVDEFYTDAQKAAVTEMCDELVEAYRSCIQNASWLSTKSKTALINKLDQMGINVMYPDDFSPYVTTKVDLSTLSEGGTFCGNCQKIIKYRRAQSLAKDGQPRPRNDWKDIDTLQINSSYYPALNSLYIYAGIIDDLTFDTDQSIYYNLGRLGTIAGHEIGHGYDTDGVCLNYNGRPEDLLTEREMNTYKKKQQKMIDAFDTFFVGEYNDQAVFESGSATIDEDFSDLISLETILSVVPSGRHRDIFDGMASIWFSYDEFDYESFLDDPHATNKARINCTFPLLNEFYAVFDVKPGNAMYVAPEYRVRIWS